jgi:hypothetical protein
MKLELIRAIDRMPPQEVEELFQQVTHKDDSEKESGLRFGALKGMLVYMSPDFDAPLEDFKEYME